jgi:hypothetical protein
MGMKKLMTRNTKSNSVLNIISQFGIIGPRLYMMGMEFIFCAAILTGVIIAEQYRLPPLFVFIGTATAAACFVLVFSGCQVATIQAAILRFQMTVCGAKKFTASLANKLLSLSIPMTNLLGRTRKRASITGEVDPFLERLATNYTYGIMASLTIITTGIVNCKDLPAFFTSSLECKGLSIHAYIITHIERWAQMTGKPPELVAS